MNAHAQELQGLIDQLKTGGRDIAFAPGKTYEIDEPLRVPGATHFSIRGRGTTITQLTDNQPVFIFEMGDSHHFELAGLTLRWKNLQDHGNQNAVGVLLDGGARSANGFYDAVFRDLTFDRGFRGIATQYFGRPLENNQIAVWDCHFDAVKGVGLSGATLYLSANIGMPGNTFSRISVRQYTWDAANARNVMIENKEPQLVLSAQRGFFADRLTLEGSFGPALWFDSSGGFVGCLRFEWVRLTQPGQWIVYFGGGNYSFGLIDFGCDLKLVEPGVVLANPIYAGVLFKAETAAHTSVVVENLLTATIESNAFRLRSDEERVRFLGIPESNLYVPPVHPRPGNNSPGANPPPTNSPEEKKKKKWWWPF